MAHMHMTSPSFSSLWPALFAAAPCHSLWFPTHTRTLRQRSIRGWMTRVVTSSDLLLSSSKPLSSATSVVASPVASAAPASCCAAQLPTTREPEPVYGDLKFITQAWGVLNFYTFNLRFL